MRSAHHATISLPEYFGTGWGVVLFYRGLWCGYCRRQLADFQANLRQIESLTARVVAASVDSEADAETMATLHGISFPIGFGLAARDIATTLGCFYEETDGFLQKCAFVLRPGGEIARAVYSTGPVGALTAADTLYSLEFFQKNPHHRVGKLRPAK
jgi:peroxiredoxin